jgi:ribosomal-protein-alanine N-acetyltransferase
MKSIANWAQSMGGIRLELEVRASNTRAIRFYERFGMRREGLRRGYYHSPGEDAVLMGMPLIPSGKIG